MLNVMSKTKRGKKMRKAILLLVLLVVWTFGSIYLWNSYIYPPKAVAYTVEVTAKVDSAALIERVRPSIESSIHSSHFPASSFIMHISSHKI